MIKGKTLTKREVYNKPRGGKRIGRIDAGIEITATEHQYQWLHLAGGGWVSAGPQQQYIQWEVVPDPVEPPPPPPVPDPTDTQPPHPETRTIIKGRTIKKRQVFKKPRGNKSNRTIQANADITATENKFQWLHLANGGWVNAGPRQQYITWEVVEEPVDTPPPLDDTEPVVTPPPPKEPWPITDIKRAGGIATLLVD
jgi:hypothetical protein